MPEEGLGPHGETGQHGKTGQPRQWVANESSQPGRRATTSSRPPATPGHGPQKGREESPSRRQKPPEHGCHGRRSRALSLAETPPEPQISKPHSPESPHGAAALPSQAQQQEREEGHVTRKRHHRLGKNRSRHKPPEHKNRHRNQQAKQPPPPHLGAPIGRGPQHIPTQHRSQGQKLRVQGAHDLSPGEEPKVYSGESTGSRPPPPAASPRGLACKLTSRPMDTSGGFRLSPTAPGVLPAVSIPFPNPFKR